MTAIGYDLLAATAIAFLFGLTAPTRRAWLLASGGIAFAAWLLRCALIVYGPEAEASLAEEYLNTLTIWNATGEIAGFAFWLAACCGLGMGAALLTRRAAKNG